MLSRNRKRYRIYEQGYAPDNGKKYCTVYSWRQAKKVCKKYGAGASVYVERLKQIDPTFISFWNIEDSFDYFGEPDVQKQEESNDKTTA